jgi:hypothetical protein
VITFAVGVTSTETIQGTASYTRSPDFPESVEGQSSIPYIVQSASVAWKVADAAHTCSASGTDDATDPFYGVDLTLEDVSTKADAPKPEPKPYYYSIRANGDPISPPIYSLAPCDPTPEPISTLFLDIGHPGPFESAPPEEIQKSDSITLLQGHFTHSDGGLTYDDTWSFTGSG